MYVTQNIRCSKALKRFAKSLDLVVLDYLTDDQSNALVSGFSQCLGANDHFCAHGNIGGFEMTMLLRSFMIPSETSSGEQFRWVVMKASLPEVSLPRVFISGDRHNVNLVRRLSHIYGSLLHAHDVFDRLNPSFMEAFNVFFHLGSSLDVSHYLDDTVLQTMFDRYQALSFEMEPEAIYLYIDASLISENHLHKTCEATIWFTQHCINMYEEPDETRIGAVPHIASP
jgi:hypothetical protein